MTEQRERPNFGEAPDRANPFALYPWLLIAISPASDVLAGRSHPAWLAGSGLVVFAVLYVTAIWLRLRADRTQVACVLAAVLAAITVAMSAGYGIKTISTLFPLLALVCGAVIPWREPRKGPPLPFAVALTVACAAALLAWLKHASGSDTWQAWYGTMLAGVIVAVMIRFIDAIAELRRTRLELARAAVDAERLRFARDLHDLLGHTLSVTVLKAQAVRKLATRDPDAAAAQAADIEEVGRQALTEVRQAVSGYRGRGLSRELDTARTALEDAGYTAVVSHDGAPVAAEADALLGWVVREGVTNVIKHSGGHQCQIDVRRSSGYVTVEITDDGHGSRGTSPGSGPAGHGPAGHGLPSGGHGLAGLRERVAAAGGTLTSGPRPGGGFRLCATLPLSETRSPQEVSV